MPSKSKSQQRFFGMVDAYKKGELKNPGSKIKKAAKGMSMDDVKDFAETKHKGLPEKVEENMNKKLIRLTEGDLHRIVKESVEKILRENMEGEGLGKWLRAGVDAASKKQRTNPQLQPYKSGKFGDSIGNWWSRTKQNAQYEDDMNYVNDPSNFRQDVNYSDMNPDSDGDYNYQLAKQRMRQHRDRLAGRGTGHNTIRTDDGRVKNFTTPSDDNYNYRNGKWRREEKDEF